jgi:hypothetical protein
MLQCSEQSKLFRLMKVRVKGFGHRRNGKLINALPHLSSLKNDENIFVASAAHDTLSKLAS